MKNAPTLTDRAALMRNRSRASEHPAMFLHDIAVDELQDRLSVVNKSFTDPVIVTGHGAYWAEKFPDFAVVADDDRLDLVAGAHDLVIHAFGLHWANDPVGQMIQCLRALRPDGLFLAVLFGGQTLYELRAVLAEAEAAISGGISPRIVPMAEIRDLGGLLQRAGFALPVADSLPLLTSYKTPTHLMHELRAMGENNAQHARIKTPTRRQVFTDAAAQYHRVYGVDDGRIAATFELIFLAGWSPDESQPKPLRPGSATARLSDVLGATQ